MRTQQQSQYKNDFNQDNLPDLPEDPEENVCSLRSSVGRCCYSCAFHFTQRNNNACSCFGNESTDTESDSSISYGDSRYSDDDDDSSDIYDVVKEDNTSSNQNDNKNDNDNIIIRKKRGCCYRLKKTIKKIVIDPGTAILILLDLILSAVGVVLSIRLTKNLHQYAYYTNQLLIPGFFILFCWPLTFLWFICYSNYKSTKKRSYFYAYSTSFSEKAEFEDSKYELRNKCNECKCECDGFIFDKNVAYKNIRTKRRLNNREKKYANPDSISSWIYHILCCYCCFSSNLSCRLGTKIKVITAFVIMAIFDSLSGILSILPIIYFPSSLAILVGQFVLPINMIGSYFVFGRKYTKVQLLGVFILIVAIFIKMLPSIQNDKGVLLKIEEALFNNNSSTFNINEDDDDTFNYNNNTTINKNEPNMFNEEDSKHLPTTSGMGYFILIVIFLISKLVSGLGSVYKEYVIKKFNLGIIFTTSCVATIQLPLSILTLFYFVLPFPFEGFGKSFDEVWKYIRESNQILLNLGTQCRVVYDKSYIINNITNSSFNSNYSGFTNHTDIEHKNILLMCESVQLFFVILIITIFSNVADLFITKGRDSTINVILNLGTVIISVFLIPWTFLSGQASGHLTIDDYTALLLIIVGTLAYYNNKSKPKKRKKVLNVGKMTKKNMVDIAKISDKPITKTIITYEDESSDDDSHQDDSGNDNNIPMATSKNPYLNPKINNNNNNNNNTNEKENYVEITLNVDEQTKDSLVDIGTQISTKRDILSVVGENGSNSEDD